MFMLFERSIENYQFFETFVFTITAAVLTLVGLIAIFLSINTQHSIQKSREIYWQLIGYLYEEQDESFFRNIRGDIKRNIELYKQTSIPSKITNSIVIISSIAIVSIIFIWWDYLNYVKSLTVDKIQISKALVYLIVVTVIFGLFIVMLLCITNPKVVGNLDSLEKIIDGNKNTSLSTISLAALSIETIVIVDYGYLQVVPKFPYKYKNLKMTTDIYVYIPDAKPYPQHKHISQYTTGEEMRLIDDIDEFSDFYGYDVKFNKTGNLSDKVYENQQCILPDLGAGNGSEIYITLYLHSKEGCLQIDFPKVIVADVYGTMEYLKPKSVIKPNNFQLFKE